ncbi:C39 family peptidase [Dysosmobacter sp.]|uniref:C39 family peptidase n=1 Tax=Dysosmobacter sp. TaxID=2591382 RepID=UPI003D89B73D
MANPGNRRRAWKAAGVILLALLCIGGMELAVCRFAAPELFARVTAPVTALVHRAASGSARLTESLAGALSGEEEESLVDQKASEPAQQDLPPVEDPAVTEFAVRNGREVLTGGVVDVVYFNQGEAPWADAAYGPDEIRGYGCGPTSMAMLISSLEAQTLDPAQAAQEADEAGYCAPGSGSYLSIVEGMAERYGLDAVSCPDLSAEELTQQLVSGNVFVALMGKGHFTDGGHFILLRGVTLEGKVLVADPNSRERSLVGWDPQLILDELSASRSNGAPLWRFSALGMP